MHVARVLPSKIVLKVFIGKRGAFASGRLVLYQCNCFLVLPALLD